MEGMDHNYRKGTCPFTQAIGQDARVGPVPTSLVGFLVPSNTKFPEGKARLMREGKKRATKSLKTMRSLQGQGDMKDRNKTSKSQACFLKGSRDLSKGN